MKLFSLCFTSFIGQNIYFNQVHFKLVLVSSGGHLKIGGMGIHIMQVQYLHRDWLNVGNGDWPREEVILLDNDLV